MAPVLSELDDAPVASSCPDLDDAPVVSGRPEHDDAAVAVMVIAWGLADTVLRAWCSLQLRNSVDVLHVGTIVVQLPRKRCGATNWSPFPACGCSDMVSCTLTHAGTNNSQLRKKLTKSSGQMWYAL